MLHWLWVALIGLVIGAIAKLIMPGKDPGGFIITGLLGIAGSLLAIGSVAPSMVRRGPIGRLHHVSPGGHCAARHLSHCKT
jgi:uncharacterized membrane protein YeaQ/YmgE (transglycosylase-associated protein family)